MSNISSRVGIILKMQSGSTFPQPLHRTPSSKTPFRIEIGKSFILKVINWRTVYQDMLSLAYTLKKKTY